MIKVIYILEDGSDSWTYEVRKLRTAVEGIREDMNVTSTIAKAVVFDENGKKILEVEKIMAQDYYTNKYGIQLEEFLIWGYEHDLIFPKYNFTTGQGFVLINALKYLVRAGKKPNEPFEKDMGKYNYYINTAVKMGFERSEAEKWVALQKSIFEDFKGRKA